MKDILIIGSEGFIGNNLVKHYLSQGWNVTGVDRVDNNLLPYNYDKVLNVGDISTLLLRSEFKYIINAAGSGNVGFSIEHPLSDFDANCFDTGRVLDAIRLSGSNSRYFHISSAAVYGNPARIPIMENDPTNPVSPYGWHKLISEIICKEYLNVYGIRSCVIRPFSVYGPGLRKQLFWDLYHKAQGKDSVELFGTGNESRDFIYISDLVRVFDILMKEAPMEAECYNVASGIETRIKEAALSFVGNFSNPPLLSFNNYTKPGDPINWKADISKISTLGFAPSVLMEEGLRLTFEWIQQCI
jgi:nucleoside-diphosphate-sugar epimerase